MASVHKRVHRGRITYRAVWRESGPGGRARLRNKSFAKAADAKIYAARMEAEVERRGVGDPARHSTGQYLSRWLATLRDRGEHSLSTLEYYARCITAAKPWVGDIPLSRLSAADLDHAYGELRKRGGRTRDGKQTRPLTARTVLNVHRCLHTALEQALHLVGGEGARARAQRRRRPRVARRVLGDQLPLARLLERSV